LINSCKKIPEKSLNVAKDLLISHLAQIPQEDLHKWLNGWLTWLYTEWQPGFDAVLEAKTELNGELAEQQARIKAEEIAYIKAFEETFFKPIALLHYSKNNNPLLLDDDFIKELIAICVDAPESLVENPHIFIAAQCLIFILSVQAMNCGIAPLWYQMILLRHFDKSELKHLVRLYDKLTYDGKTHRTDEDEHFLPLLSIMKESSFTHAFVPKVELLHITELSENLSEQVLISYPKIKHQFYTAFSGLLHVMFWQAGLAAGGEGQHVDATEDIAADVALNAHARFKAGIEYLPKAQIKYYEDASEKSIFFITGLRTIIDTLNGQIKRNTTCVNVNSENIQTRLKNSAVRRTLAELPYIQQNLTQEEINLSYEDEIKPSTVGQFANAMSSFSSLDNIPEETVYLLVAEFIEELKKQKAFFDTKEQHKEKPEYRTLTQHLFNALYNKVISPQFLKQIYKKYVICELEQWLTSLLDFKLLCDQFAYELDAQFLIDSFLNSNWPIEIDKESDLRVIIVAMGNVQWGAELLKKLSTNFFIKKMRMEKILPSIEKRNNLNRDDRLLIEVMQNYFVTRFGEIGTSVRMGNSGGDNLDTYSDTQYYLLRHHFFGFFPENQSAIIATILSFQNNTESLEKQVIYAVFNFYFQFISMPGTRDAAISQYPDHLKVQLFDWCHTHTDQFRLLVETGLKDALKEPIKDSRNIRALVIAATIISHNNTFSRIVPPFPINDLFIKLFVISSELSKHDVYQSTYNRIHKWVSDKIEEYNILLPEHIVYQYRDFDEINKYLEGMSDDDFFEKPISAKGESACSLLLVNIEKNTLDQGEKANKIGAVTDRAKSNPVRFFFYLRKFGFDYSRCIQQNLLAILQGSYPDKSTLLHYLFLDWSAAKAHDDRYYFDMIKSISDLLENDDKLLSKLLESKDINGNTPLHLLFLTLFQRDQQASFEEKENIDAYYLNRYIFNRIKKHPESMFLLNWQSSRPFDYFCTYLLEKAKLDDFVKKIPELESCASEWLQIAINQNYLFNEKHVFIFNLLSPKAFAQTVIDNPNRKNLCKFNQLSVAQLVVLLDALLSEQPTIRSWYAIKQILLEPQFPFTDNEKSDSLVMRLIEIPEFYSQISDTTILDKVDGMSLPPETRKKFLTSLFSYSNDNYVLLVFFRKLESANKELLELCLRAFLQNDRLQPMGKTFILHQASQLGKKFERHCDYLNYCDEEKKYAQDKKKILSLLKQKCDGGADSAYFALTYLNDLIANPKHPLRLPKETAILSHYFTAKQGCTKSYIEVLEHLAKNYSNSVIKDVIVEEAKRLCENKEPHEELNWFTKKHLEQIIALCEITPDSGLSSAPTWKKD
jgi:hypothetical protein